MNDEAREMNSSTPHWPCPYHCETWCRTDLRFRDGELQPTTNHHPRCTLVDASLVDVYVVCLPGEEHGCVMEDAAAALAMANEDPHAPLEVKPRKMHREILDRLGEFAGF